MKFSHSECTHIPQKLAQTCLLTEIYIVYFNQLILDIHDTLSELENVQPF